MNDYVFLIQRSVDHVLARALAAVGQAQATVNARPLLVVDEAIGILHKHRTGRRIEELNAYAGSLRRRLHSKVFGASWYQHCWGKTTTRRNQHGRFALGLLTTEQDWRALEGIRWANPLHFEALGTRGVDSANRSQRTPPTTFRFAGALILGDLALAVCKHVLAINLELSLRVKANIKIELVPPRLQHMKCGSPLAPPKTTQGHLHKARQL
mmetsp:Transcript_64381/g.112388  ORF Transcript_64381/g.112388 Transcript_64381/m.112388 type:complete len:211 (+) Transcript_64381:1246-1878(+)